MIRTTLVFAIFR